MKQLRILALSVLLGMGLFAPHLSQASEINYTVELNRSMPSSWMPFRTVVKVIRRALPHVNQEMGTSFTVGQGLYAYYVQESVSITKVGTDGAGKGLYRLVYLDCSVVIAIEGG